MNNEIICQVILDLAKNKKAAYAYNEHYGIYVDFSPCVDMQGEALIDERDRSYAVVEGLDDKTQLMLFCQNIWRTLRDFQKISPAIPEGNLTELGGDRGLIQLIYGYFWARSFYEQIVKTPCPEGCDSSMKNLEDRIKDGVLNLSHLSGLTQLRWLDLSLREITDLDLSHLSGLTKLRVLDLSFTDISDESMSHLSGLTQLRVLDLWNTQVSDEGMSHLSGLTQLRVLYLGGTQVSDAGVEAIRSALPKLEVYR